MIAISITAEAYEAIRARLLDPPPPPPPPGPDSLIRIWLDRKFVDELDRLLRPGDSYSDVILRLAITRAAA
jgi:hypothetical protein